MKESKNQFFKDSLLNHRVFFNNAGQTLNHVLEDNGDVILMQLGPTKFVTLRDKAFKPYLSPDHPNVFLLFINDPSIQIVAISTNDNAFSTSFVVANLLESNLNVSLDRYSLEVSIKQLSAQADRFRVGLKPSKVSR